MDTSIFEELGLTKGEIKVYIALLNLGSATAGPIIEKSGLQNSVVHLALNSLTEKGLISIIKEGKRNKYSAANPKHFLEFIDEKKQRFENILPELLKQQSSDSKKPEVILFHGIRGVKELFYELLETDSKEHNTINSPESSLMLGEDWWINYHTKRANKNIKAKLIFNESLRKFAQENKDNYKKTEIRFTAYGFEPLTETIIRGEIMAIIIYSEIPFGILIKNKDVTKSYEQYFQIMWDLAKK